MDQEANLGQGRVSHRLVAELQVGPETDTVRCPWCDAEIHLSRNPKNNPLYCLGDGKEKCGIALILTDEQGHDLNLWWGSLKTSASRKVGKIFRCAKFPDKAIAEQWEHFEKNHTELDIVAYAERLQRQAQEHQRPVGSSCWREIMAYFRSRNETVQQPQGDEELIFVGLEDIGPGF